MSRKMNKVLVGLAAAFAVSLLTLGVALASDCGWCDEMANSLTFYKATYPASNFDPYSEKVGIVRDAMSRGDEKTAKAEIGKLFQMLRTRAHGINDVAADELSSYWQLVLPIEDLKVTTPFTIQRVPDTKKDYRPEDQDNMGGSEGG